MVLLLFVAWFSAMSTWFALTNPIYAAPDEPEHTAYVWTISTKRSLPDQYNPLSRTPQGHHHPLYYVAASVALRAMGLRLPYSNQRNGWAMSGGDRTGIMALRLMNVGVGAATIFLLGFLAWRFLGIERWWIAPAGAAMLPQFQFICASVSNEPVAALAGVAVLGVALSLSQRGSFGSGLMGGAIFGIALLAKKSLLALAPMLLVAAFLSERRAEESRRPFLGALSGVLIGATLTFGWWVTRNVLLYRELLGSRMEAQTLRDLVEQKALLDPYFLTDFPLMTGRSFIAHFGWMDVPVSRLIIALYGVVLIGLLLASLTDLRRSGIAWLGILGMVAGLISYNLTFTQPQGRLLFPALGAIGMAMAIGAERWAQVRGSGTLAYPLVGALAAANVAAVQINLQAYP